MTDQERTDRAKAELRAWGHEEKVWDVAVACVIQHNPQLLYLFTREPEAAVRMALAQITGEIHIPLTPRPMQLKEPTFKAQDFSPSEEDRIMLRGMGAVWDENNAGE